MWHAVVARADVFKASLVVGWLLLQSTLIATAGARPEHAFGFRMFGEASTISYSLFRLVRDPDGRIREVRCENGRYSVQGRGTDRLFFDWHDWVKTRGLGSFDREIFASYGVAAQRARLQAAVESFAGQIRGDHETLRFVLRGYTSRNGGPKESFAFESPPVTP